MSLYLSYPFWLAAISAACLLAERLHPWRREQRMLRRGLGQDLLWLVLNGHYVGVALWIAGETVLAPVRTALVHAGVPWIDTAALLRGASLPLELLVLFVCKDLCDYAIHNLLHRVPALWNFHKVHHTIEELDFWGNFRFHWMEAVVYKTLSYVPLVLLGASGRAVLIIAIVSTLIGHLNHSNLALDWGPLRYVVNSPKMHVWHHDFIQHGAHGQNFGVMLSLWDWVFGTAYLPPAGQPAQLGFAGQERYPRGFIARLLYPLSALVRGPAAAASTALNQPPMSS